MATKDAELICKAGLRDLALKAEYRTNVDDIVRDFYTPALRRSRSYLRAVGYFTSQGLAVAAQGLVAFVQGGGSMRLIASPVLQPEDVEAISQGYTDRQHVVRTALLRQIETVPDAVTQNRLGFLAWLVSENRLEIRIAVPVTAENNLRHGIYHEKLGIFEDVAGNVVAFTGSPNETAGGLVENFETVDVFCSWDDPQGRVERKRENFERLWANETRGLTVVPFPEAVCRQLLRFRPESMPVEESVLSRSEGSTESESYLALWSHQRDAVQAWERNGRRGLISMATGSGKTRTALVAAERCPDLRLLVVAVPRVGLVEQWAEVMAQTTRFPRPMLACESAVQWQEVVFTRLRALRHSAGGSPVVIIGTMHSLSGQRFRSVLSDAGLQGNTLLIVDEVHNVGAPHFRQALREEFQWRLGLSATPVRHFDEEGTEVIHSYFGSTVYVYDMRQALRDGYLCPYRYYVYAAYLSEQEYDEYRTLTRKISQLRGSAGAGDVTHQSDNALDGDSEEIKSLLFKRARVLKKCASKSEALLRALQEHPMKRGLVYCADNEQLTEMAGVLEQRGIIYLVYTANTPKPERRRALESLDRGHVGVLLAIDCLDEGVDVPNVDNAVILASSSNKRQFIQRRGRILRNAPGKSHATLVDIVALPPTSAGLEAKKMLAGELARAKEMAALADNRYEALNQMKACTAQYGVLITELLTGEGDG